MTPHPPPPPAQQRPTLWIVATCALAVVAVALAIVVAMTMLGDDEPGASAESSAQAACELVAQIPDDGFELTTEGDEVNPHSSRLNAAVTLAMLASDQDDSYESLVEEFQQPREIIAQKFDASGDDFVDALGEARDACADEGL